MAASEMKSEAKLAFRIFQCYCCDGTICEFIIDREDDDKSVPKHCPMDGRLLDLQSGVNWWSEIKM